MECRGSYRAGCRCATHRAQHNRETARYRRLVTMTPEEYDAVLARLLSGGNAVDAASDAGIPVQRVYAYARQDATLYALLYDGAELPAPVREPAPLVRRTPPTAFTLPRQRRFIRALREGATITMAASRAGVSVTSVRRFMRANAAFASAVEEARQEARE